MAACILTSDAGFATTFFLQGGGTKKAVMARLKNKEAKTAVVLISCFMLYNFEPGCSRLDFYTSQKC